MVERDFYLKMKCALESEMFREELYSRNSEEARRFFLVKYLYFLIGTKDFDNFTKYLSRYYKDVYPFEYLGVNTSMNDYEIEETVYRNMLIDGFLFHVTPQSNVNNILQNGLLTLNDKYGCDMFLKSDEVNETYVSVKERNQGLDILKMRQIVSIPGITGYEHDRFNNVFLSSNLEYALKTYGENGELSSMFLRDILWAFGIKKDVYGIKLEEIKSLVIKSVKDNGVHIYEPELERIFSFLDLIYEEKVTTDDSRKAIVMVPTKDIVNSTRHFNEFFRGDDYMAWPLSMIHEFHSGEVQNEGSISPDNLMVLDLNEDNSFVLKKKGV